MMRRIDIEFPAELAGQLEQAASSVKGARWFSNQSEQASSSASVLVPSAASQALLDALHDLLEGHAGWRIIVLPVEAALLPEQDQIPQEDMQASEVLARREEIFQDVSMGTRLNAELMWRATRTALAGLSVGFLTALLLGWAMGVNLGSGEILGRTHVGVDSVALALASGGAAALSILTGLSSTLVGVMVAVALLPPSVAVIS